MSSPVRGGPSAVRPGSVSPGGRPGAARLRRELARLVALGALWLAGVPGAAAELKGSLADSAATILGEARDRATWGVLAVSLDRGDTLLAVDPGRRLIPGSNLKLFTVGAFLLNSPGPDARGTTYLVARGSTRVDPKKGSARLKGDLVLCGSGWPDVVPLLSPGSRGLVDSLAFLLRAQGLERFEGTLWVDGSLFARSGYPRGWAVEDLPLGYGAPANAILANGNAASVVAVGGPAGVTVSLDPPEAPLVLQGVVALGDSGSAPWLSVSRDLCDRTVRVTGSVPKGRTIRRTVSVPDPDSTSGLFLLGAMRRAGIGTRATVRVTGRGDPRDPTASAAWRYAPPGGRGGAWSLAPSGSAVVALPSPTGREVASAVLAYSLNTESEALLRWLDLSPRGKTAERGLAGLRAAVAAAGIDSSDVSFVDGSGLSPQDLVTPRAVVRWLTHVDRALPAGARLADLLPRPGAPGTLERRLLEVGPDSLLHLKTGTLTNVSALAGYVTTRAGERIAFSMLSNGNNGSAASARAVEDALLSLLARSAPRPPAPAGRALGIPR